MVFFPPQGTSQLQVLRHRLRPNYWPPQGIGGALPIIGSTALVQTTTLSALVQTGTLSALVQTAEV